ncbi:MAG: branched-chain amino acid ABC transporter permease, partial [Pseudomonadota bacterium]
MSTILIIEQVLNGLQFGVMLFLMAAGLTLIFGVMGLINLAHGSLYMVGAFAAAAVAGATGSFFLGLVAALAAAAIAGAVIEMVVIRRLYAAPHLDQVLATFALILIFSEGTRWVFGSFPLFLDIPAALAGPVTLPGGIEYPLYRLALIGIGLLVGLGLWALIERTRIGIQIRAGENDREMIAALGVDISKLYTLIFALGAALAGLAGALV